MDQPQTEEPGPLAPWLHLTVEAEVTPAPVSDPKEKP